MEWPYRRFIRAFDAFQRRLACDYLRARKIAHVAALYANCVTTDIEILTKRGWLNCNEVETGDFTIGFNPDTRRSEWTPVTAVHYHEDADTILVGNKFWEIRTTPNHRWLTKQTAYILGTHGKEQFRTVDEFNWDTYVVCSEPFEGDGLSITDDEAELIGWVLTDGCIAKHAEPKTPGARRKFNLWVYQSKLAQVAHLDDLLAHFDCKKELVREADPPPVEREYGVFYNNLSLYRWRLQTDLSLDIYDRAGLSINKKEGVIDFVLSLSRSQLIRFMEGAWLAEGTIQGKNGRAITQQHGPIADALEIGIYLLGYRPTMSYNSRGMMHHYTFGIPRMRAKWLSISEPRREDVWCVTTELGTWTARNSKSIFLTGNSNLDGEDSPRTKMIMDIEHTYEELITEAWNGTPNTAAREDEPEPAFMQAGRRAMAAMMQQPVMPGEQALAALPN